MNTYQLIDDYRKSAPVDVVGLCSELGIELSYETMEDDVSGQIEKKDDGKFRITINKADGLTRQRFTIAHELGHYILHRPLIGDGITEDRMYRSTSGKYNNTSISSHQETEANSFAAYLLMPEQLVTDYEDQGLNVDAMAERLQVSKQAMSIKLSR
ncbi:MAG: ImmA/IrrE family metallo-endopeptidase [Proteobacteria bacterium]|nr:ImmA/IrrE family metallo-endopeptidase [Pseudomonadota bacterium]NOG61003.1 ImmA/IrrE family metallo-endopeptidase [Pseudomonadota bacterium]